MSGTIVLSPQAAMAAPPSVTKVSGGGATGEQSASVSKAARKGSGSASGTFTVSVPGLTRTVNVTQIVNPTPERDGYMCLVGTDSQGQVVLYIRDTGDGTTTFDGWGFTLGGTGLTCDNVPLSPVLPKTLETGDFQTSISPPP